jgi:hypothetical protein
MVPRMEPLSVPQEPSEGDAQGVGRAVEFRLGRGACAAAQLSSGLGFQRRGSGGSRQRHSAGAQAAAQRGGDPSNAEETRDGSGSDWSPEGLPRATQVGGRSRCVALTPVGKAPPLAPTGEWNGGRVGVSDFVGGVVAGLMINRSHPQPNTSFLSPGVPTTQVPLLLGHLLN